jgi:cytidylate kinase
MRCFHGESKKGDDVMSFEIEQIVDRRVLEWELRDRMAARKNDSDALVPAVITIESEMGTYDVEIAQAVADALHVPVHDRDILSRIAQDARVSQATVDTLDREVQSSIEDRILALMNERNFDRHDYMIGLRRTIHQIWDAGTSVIMGHGAAYVVPREHTLAVKLVAPEGERARRVATQRNIGYEHARRLVHESDLKHHAYIERYFNRTTKDAEAFDLVLDTAGFGVRENAALILQAFRFKFRSGVPKEDAAA